MYLIQLIFSKNDGTSIPILKIILRRLIAINNALVTRIIDIIFLQVFQDIDLVENILVL